MFISNTRGYGSLALAFRDGQTGREPWSIPVLAICQCSDGRPLSVPYL